MPSHRPPVFPSPMAPKQGSALRLSQLSPIKKSWLVGLSSNLKSQLVSQKDEQKVQPNRQSLNNRLTHSLDSPVVGPLWALLSSLGSPKGGMASVTGQPAGPLHCPTKETSPWSGSTVSLALQGQWGPSAVLAASLQTTFPQVGPPDSGPPPPLSSLHPLAAHQAWIRLPSCQEPPSCTGPDLVRTHKMPCSCQCPTATFTNSGCGEMWTPRFSNKTPVTLPPPHL